MKSNVHVFVYIDFFFFVGGGGVNLFGEAKCKRGFVKRQFSRTQPQLQILEITMNLIITF